MKILFYYLILALSFNQFVNKNENNIDKIFVNWNIATSKSMQSQEETVNNGYQKSLYENRLKAFKSYIDVTDLNQLNKKSIRYKLLDQYLNDWGNKFYIVEANKSGERIRVMSHIIIPENKKSSKIIKYQYENEKWVKVKEFNILYNYQFNKEYYAANFGKGQNENDMTVSYIENGDVVSSDFFLFMTMKDIEVLKEE